jgi:hypothetical protein
MCSSAAALLKLRAVACRLTALKFGRSLGTLKAISSVATTGDAERRCLRLHCLYAGAYMPLPLSVRRDLEVEAGSAADASALDASRKQQEEDLLALEEEGRAKEESELQQQEEEGKAVKESAAGARDEL